MRDIKKMEEKLQQDPKNDQLWQDYANFLPKDSPLQGIRAELINLYFARQSEQDPGTLGGLTRKQTDLRKDYQKELGVRINLWDLALPGIVGSLHDSAEEIKTAFETEPFLYGLSSVGFPIVQDFPYPERIRSLNLYNLGIGDDEMKQLTGFKNLSRLDLSLNYGVSDLGAKALLNLNFDVLRFLDLTGANVSYEMIECLREHLPNTKDEDEDGDGVFFDQEIIYAGF